MNKRRDNSPARSPRLWPLFALSLLSVTAVPAAAKAPAKLTTAEYRRAVQNNVTSLSQPMFELFKKERAEIVRAVVPECRKGSAFAACRKDSNSISCHAASRCPFDSRQEENWLKEANINVDRAYARISTEFHAKLTGHRRHFSIGTMNKLVTKFNMISVVVFTSMGSGVENMFRECAKDAGEEVDFPVVECLYDRLEQVVAKSAAAIERGGPELKSFVENDLATRIAGYTDKKNK